MTIPEECQAAVFHGVGKPLQLREVPLVEPAAGHLLAKVRLAAICGSDLHTVTGRRVEPVPLVLGHEIVAEVAALGQGVNQTAEGRTLTIGDRISFTVTASCGACGACRSGLPQKCESLFKYGHASLEDGTGLNGGFAEYIYLRPGTAVYHIPSCLSDREACPANCALATVTNGLDAIAVGDADRVLVQGAGLLGLYTVALARSRGASEVVVTDIDDARLGMARRFKADEVVNTRGMGEREILGRLGERRFDVAVEVCGEPSVVSQGLQLLALRGRYLIMGLVCAGSDFTVDGNNITRNYLTIKGVHNYAPNHLAKSLDYLRKTRSSLPYRELIGPVFPLTEVNAAFNAALGRKGIRIAIRP